MFYVHNILFSRNLIVLLTSSEMALRSFTSFDVKSFISVCVIFVLCLGILGIKDDASFG